MACKIPCYEFNIIQCVVCDKCQNRLSKPIQMTHDGYESIYFDIAWFEIQANCTHGAVEATVVWVMERARICLSLHLYRISYFTLWSVYLAVLVMRILLHSLKTER